MVGLDISDRDAAIFDIIVTDPRVIVPVADLPLDAEDSLATLEAAGLISAYEWDDVLSVTLSPFAAESAGLRVAGCEPYHWEPIDALEVPIRLAQRQERLGTEEHVDPRLAEPLAEMEAAESVDVLLRKITKRRPGEPTTAVDRDPDASPRPNILLEGCRAWTNPEALPGEPCRACLGRKLGRYSYCLLCYRWGLDDIVRRWWAAVEAQSKRLAKPAKKRPKFRPRIKSPKVQAVSA